MTTDEGHKAPHIAVDLAVAAIMYTLPQRYGIGLLIQRLARWVNDDAVSSHLSDFIDRRAAEHADWKDVVTARAEAYREIAGLGSGQVGEAVRGSIESLSTALAVVAELPDGHPYGDDLAVVVTDASAQISALGALVAAASEANAGRPADRLSLPVLVVNLGVAMLNGHSAMSTADTIIGRVADDPVLAFNSRDAYPPDLIVKVAQNIEHLLPRYALIERTKAERLVDGLPELPHTAPTFYEMLEAS